ncbi:hypothetical protein LDENG_00268180 [Lucifuga dentata]|nr:hypothetical protein LDENG_00268180 [Lucifuga dentata]
MGLSSALCTWTLNSLSDRPQKVRLGDITSTILMLSTGVSQGCMLSPVLYALFTHDCAAIQSSNIIIKFTGDMTIIGVITEEVKTLTSRCHYNNLHLNVNKTKEMVLYFRRAKGAHTPFFINGPPVETVRSFRFLGVHINEDLNWSTHTMTLRSGLLTSPVFLWRLRRFTMDRKILCNFYSAL